MDFAAFFHFHWSWILCFKQKCKIDHCMQRYVPTYKVINWMNKYHSLKLLLISSSLTWFETKILLKQNNSETYIHWNSCSSWSCEFFVENSAKMVIGVDAPRNSQQFRTENLQHKLISPLFKYKVVKRINGENSIARLQRS